MDDVNDFSGESDCFRGNQPSPKEVPMRVRYELPQKAPFALKRNSILTS